MIFTAEAADSGKRLDVFVADAAGLSRSASQKLIEGGEVLVFGKPENKKYTVKPCDVIEISIPEPEELAVEAENIPLDKWSIPEGAWARGEELSITSGGRKHGELMWAPFRRLWRSRQGRRALHGRM